MNHSAYRSCFLTLIYYLFTVFWYIFPVDFCNLAIKLIEAFKEEAADRFVFDDSFLSRRHLILNASNAVKRIRAISACLSQICASVHKRELSWPVNFTAKGCLNRKLMGLSRAAKILSSGTASLCINEQSV